MHLTRIEPKVQMSGTYSHLCWRTLPLHHWGHDIPSKLVLYMSHVAYLGNVFKPKGYETCYICPGPVFQCEFNGNVHFIIGLTKYGNFYKYRSVYMFLAPFFKRISTITVII